MGRGVVATARGTTNNTTPQEAVGKAAPRQQHGSHGLRTGADGEPVPARRGLRHDGAEDLDPPLHDTSRHDRRVRARARCCFGQRGPNKTDRRRAREGRAAEGVERPAPVWKSNFGRPTE